MNNATLSLIAMPIATLAIVATTTLRRQRNAWVCYRCEPPYRVFLQPDEPRPRCPVHGLMERQPNRPYRKP